MTTPNEISNQSTMSNYCFLRETYVDSTSWAVSTNSDCTSCPFFGLCSAVKLEVFGRERSAVTQTPDGDIQYTRSHNEEGFQLVFEEENGFEENEFEDDEDGEALDYLDYDEEDVIGLAETGGNVDDDDDDHDLSIDERELLREARAKKKREQAKKPKTANYHDLAEQPKNVEDQMKLGADAYAEANGASIEGGTEHPTKKAPKAPKEPKASKPPKEPKAPKEPKPSKLQKKLDDLDF